MTTANPLVGPSPLRDVINPQFYQNNFPAEVYIKTELGIKLDKGKLDNPLLLTLTAQAFSWSR